MTIAPDRLYEMGGVPVGMAVLQPPEVRWVYSDATAAPYLNLAKQADHSKLHSTVALAHAAVTSARNDTVFLTPETHTWTAVLDWTSSNTHLIGMHSPSRWSNNCKITHTSAASLNNLLTVSGSDNLIANIHFQYAVGANGANHTCLYNTGSGNLYENCWFEGPCDATQGDDTSFRLVNVDGGGNLFRNCVFGSTSVKNTAAALLGFTGSAYRTTFENCIFYFQGDNASSTMIDFSSGNNDISGPQFFKGCQFVNWSDNWATKGNYLIRCAGGSSASSGGLIFDPSCMVVGFTDIAEFDTVGYAPFFFGLQYTATPNATYAGLVIPAVKT